MLLYPIKGYDEFKELFGLREHANGSRSRNNSILLSFLKHKPLIQYIKRKQDFQLLSIRSMARLKNECLERLQSYDWDKPGACYIKDRRWSSSVYRTDNYKGRTVDGDPKSIRYVRVDNDKVYKMKAGKMYRNLILESEFGQALPCQVVTWLCEELSAEWEGYNVLNKYTLRVDDDFEFIYNSDNYRGNFGSCMADHRQYHFYEDSVCAKAASLLENTDDPDDDPIIVARAVIFTEVNDITAGRTLRLCERQYSTNGDDLLKQVLVNRLIAEGYIDGYKRVGADCHSPKAFILNDGTPIQDHKLEIRCDVDVDGTISYQDSFKWYDIDTRTAYNYDSCEYSHMLDTTSSTLDQGDMSYDEYHERYTRNDTVEVCYEGRWIDCDEEDLDDFERINGRLYHRDMLACCDCCGDLYVMDDECYSELTGGSYCCYGCLESAEEEYCEEHPDEYVWLDDRAVRIEDTVVCPECGERIHKFSGYNSTLLHKQYCSSNCMKRAEYVYLSNCEDEHVTICPDCHSIHFKNNMVTDDDGYTCCPNCAKTREILRALNATLQQTA